MITIIHFPDQALINMTRLEGIYSYEDRLMAGFYAQGEAYTANFTGSLNGIGDKVLMPDEINFHRKFFPVYDKDDSGVIGAVPLSNINAIVRGRRAEETLVYHKSSQDPFPIPYPVDQVIRLYLIKVGFTILVNLGDPTYPDFT